jgi:alkylation response protein AidB-like acyl-CoA dehydrogenase
MRLPTEDEHALRDAARDLLVGRAGPERLRAMLDTPSGHDDELWKLISELGWTALTLPEHLDGLGLGLVEVCAVVEECGRALMPSAFTGTTAVAWTAARTAVGAQLLAGLGSGTRPATWSLAALDGTGTVGATPTASGGFLLDGQRRHVADATAASTVLLDVAGPDGPLLAVVVLDHPGVSTQVEHTLDLTRRYARLDLIAVEVAAEDILGESAARRLGQAGVVLQCAESIGVAGRAFDMTVGYAGQRSQFGRPIGSFQAVKHRIADMFVELEGARVATRDAAEAVETERADAAFAVHTAKSWTGRAASWITSQAIQLHGGTGFTWEHDLHLLQRRVKVNELLLGAPAWHEQQLTGLLEAGAEST